MVVFQPVKLQEFLRAPSQVQVRLPQVKNRLLLLKKSRLLDMMELIYVFSLQDFQITLRATSCTWKRPGHVGYVNRTCPRTDRTGRS